MIYKGKEITPYESFYWNTTDNFFRGQLGGGISRCVKTDNSLAVMEEVKIGAMRGRNPDNPNERGKSNGNYQQRLEINENGTSNTITSVQKDNLVIEPQVINPLKGKSDKGWHFEQQVYDAEGSGNIPKVIEPTEETATTICLNSKVDGKQPSLEHRIYDCSGNSTAITTGFHSSIAEPKVEQVGNIYPDTETFKNRTMGRVYSDNGISSTINCCGGGDREPKIVQIDKCDDFVVGSMQKNAYKGTTDGVSPTITAACGMGGGQTPMVGNKYRIRKLTPRECFRLMDVKESDIDKIQSAGISNSQQYKLAGNSIVVANLYHLFRKMFIETDNEQEQLNLF